MNTNGNSHRYVIVIPIFVVVIRVIPVLVVRIAINIGQRMCVFCWETMWERALVLATVAGAHNCMPTWGSLPKSEVFRPCSHVRQDHTMRQAKSNHSSSPAVASKGPISTTAATLHGCWYLGLGHMSTHSPDLVSCICYLSIATGCSHLRIKCHTRGASLWYGDSTG